VHNGRDDAECSRHTPRKQAAIRVRKNPGFFKKAQPSGFLGVLLGFFGQAGKE